LQWAVRTYASTTSGNCVELGRVQDGQFGRLDDDETFHQLPPDDGGTCGDLQSEPVLLAVNTYPANGTQQARTVVFGVASANVATVAVTPKDEPARQATLDAARSFVVPILGVVDPTDLPVTVTLRDGHSVSYPW
jgi:hypothetical protein